MNLTQLDDRVNPSFVGVRDGWFIAPDSGDFLPYPDYLAAHSSAATEDTVVIGSAEGGGPRVQVRVDGHVTADFFAFDPSFRGGVNVAVYGDFVVVGAGTGGGPVVGVFTKEGTEVSRFFAYDPEFRGGVYVGADSQGVHAVPGFGGGPLHRTFDWHGTPLDDAIFLGDDPTVRDIESFFIGDVTHDGRSDKVIGRGGGRATIVDGATGYSQDVSLPAGFDRIGYGGVAATVGNHVNYQRAGALWTSFPRMTEFEFSDAGAGNPNPPPTTGTRPGVYHGRTNQLPGTESVTETTTLASESVGSSFGTGSSYVSIHGRLVTASHVVRAFPTGRVENLTKPGQLDGTPVLAGVEGFAPDLGNPYTVDAASFRPIIPIDDFLHLGDQIAPLGGVADVVSPGDPLITIGRGEFVGVGSVVGYQADSVPIRWPDGSIQNIAGQITGVRGATALAVPGFSGGVAFTVTFTAAGIRRDIVGMVVAGNNVFTFITPHNKIVEALS